MEMDKLRAVRTGLERRYDEFPHNRCWEAARAVYDATGYEMVESLFFEHPQAPTHHWHNYDPVTKRNIDLSADQFKNVQHSILITDAHSSLYKRIDRD